MVGQFIIAIFPTFAINTFTNINLCVYYYQYGVDLCNNYWIRNLA